MLGRTQILQALESARYRRLMEDLARFLDHPPATGQALRPASTEAAELVNNQARIVDRTYRAVVGALSVEVLK